MGLTEWIEGYRKAWEAGDTELVLTLFTEDASYRSNPFEELHLSHDGIRAYWDGVTGQQSDARVSMGRPFVDGHRVAVEWWTTMVSEGEEVSLPGCLLLRFEPDGRCSDLREYWNFTSGSARPLRRLGVQLGFDEYALGPGDSIAFDSTQPHRLWNLGDVPVRGIWFVVGREG